jgi:flagellar biogenesis protein FliO
VVVEGFNSPDWYWVLTSAVVSLVVVSLVVLFVAYYVKRVAAHLKRRSYR